MGSLKVETAAEAWYVMVGICFVVIVITAILVHQNIYLYHMVPSPFSPPQLEVSSLHCSSLGFTILTLYLTSQHTKLFFMLCVLLAKIS